MSASETRPKSVGTGIELFQVLIAKLVFWVGGSSLLAVLTTWLALLGHLSYALLLLATGAVLGYLAAEAVIGRLETRLIDKRYSGVAKVFAQAGDSLPEIGRQYGSVSVREWSSRLEKLGQLLYNSLFLRLREAAQTCGEMRILSSGDFLTTLEKASKREGDFKFEIIGYLDPKDPIVEAGLWELLLGVHGDREKGLAFCRHIGRIVGFDKYKLARIRALLQSGYLYIYVSKQPIEPQFGVIGDRYVYVQDYHEPGRPKATWLIADEHLGALFGQRIGKIKEASSFANTWLLTLDQDEWEKCSQDAS